jgi:hypothetical protein
MATTRTRWRAFALAALVVGGIAGLTLVGLRFALHRVPDFYAQAIAIPAAEQEAAGETLERNVLALHNEVRDSGRWSAVFTDEQINGWLAADLPEKFPQVLPPEICDPRVAFVPGQMQIACRYAGDAINSIVSLTLEVRLADEPNTLAVRICGARAGLVPLPLKQLLDRVTESVRNGDLLVRWVQSAGDPVALITLSASDPQGEEAHLVLEQIEIRAGEVHLAGRTVAPDDSHALPSAVAPRR